MLFSFSVFSADENAFSAILALFAVPSVFKISSPKASERAESTSEPFL